MTHHKLPTAYILLFLDVRGTPVVDGAGLYSSVHISQTYRYQRTITALVGFGHDFEDGITDLAQQLQDPHNRWIMELLPDATVTTLQRRLDPIYKPASA